MINLFCGWDKRECDGWHVFAHSVITHASKPVSLIPLANMGMAQGSNTFTLSRFLVPSLMNYQGHAIFADACDMLMLSDVVELDALFDPDYAVQVVKHDNYSTKHKTKYKGTEMECPNMDYARKNWASLMIINCEHPAWKIDPPSMQAHELLQFKFLKDEEIGEIPESWNRLVDEGHHQAGARLLHWTAGIPSFPAYAEAPAADLWKQTLMEVFVHGR